MSAAAAETDTVRLVDYRPPDFLIDTVFLDVRLDASDTRVTADLAIRPNPAGRPGLPLVLDGDELGLVSALLDGAALPASAYTATPERFTLHAPPSRPFTLRLVTQLDPSANTKLMGLYRSSGTYCTQCEAEGFRRITYFLDRPDVMAVYTTRLEAAIAEAPILLGNGNPGEAGDIPGTGRHFAVWHDPHPKPAYLFALVAGDLDAVTSEFVTRSGRRVDLGIHVEKGKAARADWAMDSLKRSMRWDEEVFGCEYDLDVFNIVAVSDFNMGAMENKGLNIFNDKYILADSETATDADYDNIDAVIAHEYFHNWTGNRITCRDWFQLCLKEGLTVFRDQEYSGDMRSRAVERIGDVLTLRAAQFSEDSGPLAHPVRPSAYRAIDNFYTATVYEKGAELVRMIRSLIGPSAFRAGMDLYLKRCDGTAATVEDFLACFGEAGGLDVQAFMRWYEQAGTPRLVASGHHDPAAWTYRLDLAQSTPPTPGQAEKRALVIPLALGLVGANGGAVPLVVGGRPLVRDLVVLDTESASITFENVPTKPVPSLNRGFSAPVRLEIDLTDEDLLHLLRHDSDPFNRWQAAHTVALRLLKRSAASVRAGGGPLVEPAHGEALATFLEREGLSDPAFAAMVAILPSEAEVAREIGADVDPDAIHLARDAARAGLGRRLMPLLARLRKELAQAGPYSPDATSAGRRDLANTALVLMVAADAEAGAREALRQFDAADNMTDRFRALSALTLVPGAAREAALARFATRYASEPLVLDKWFALQAMIPEEGTLARVRGLMSHPAFSMKNPNRLRAVVATFANGNPTQFARADGAGFEFLADIVLEVDVTNPQTAARLLTAFRTWRVHEAGRQGRARAALRRIAAKEGLSRDVSDIVTRSLAG